jgi:hypothetical protein
LTASEKAAGKNKRKPAGKSVGKNKPKPTGKPPVPAMPDIPPSAPDTYAHLSAHTILGAFYAAVYSLTPGREAGSHTEIFAMDPDRLATVLGGFVQEKEGADAAAFRAGAIQRWCSTFAGRFLFKVGRTSNFTMRLGGARPVEIPRAVVSEVFGGIGYSLFPTWRKTVSDSLEAAREIPYFFMGEPRDLFLFPVDDAVRRLLCGLEPLPITGDEASLFLIRETHVGNERLSFYDVMARDPYAKGSLPDRPALARQLDQLRTRPFSDAVVTHLREFFDAPITVGVRDTLRWLNGARHPDMNWDEARGIIESCFARHSGENYLLPEQNFYIPAPSASPQEIADLARANRVVVRTAAVRFRRACSARLKRVMTLADIEDVLGEVLGWHHGYPQYRLEETVGVINPSTLKVGLKFVEQLSLFLAKVDMPVRRNAQLVQHLEACGIKEKLSANLLDSDYRELVLRLAQFLLFYDLRHGIRTSRGLIEYRNILTTFCTFQERADWLPGDCEKLAQFSLESLAKAEYSGYLRKYPELAEKLVVFFVQVLRFFLDTDFIPDLRPDEAGINIFILGIWGYITENMIITLYRDPEGVERFRLKFVDNKDHFKQYKREVDKDRPMGLAKHGLRIVQPVVLPAMLRSVGNFVQIVHENRNGYGRKEISLPGLVELGMAVAQEVILKGIDYSSDSLQALIADGLDDAGKFAASAARVFTAGENPDRVI